MGRYQDQRSPPGRTLTQFHKKDSTANYDFLFLPSSEVTASNESNTSTDYTRRINTTLNLLFGLLPGNGELTHLTITERKDRNFVSFRIPRFVIDDYHFQSEITVLEDSLNQQWNTEGEFNPSERRLYATLHAPQLTVPYIHRRFGAEVQFDSLTCNFSQEKLTTGLHVWLVSRKYGDCRYIISGCRPKQSTWIADNWIST